MAEKFKSIYINHVPRQQNVHADALASIAASLALPTRVTKKVLVHSRDLYCQNSPLKTVRTRKEIFESMRFLRLQQVQKSGIGDSHSSTMSYTVYCLMILRRQLPLEGKLLDSITKQLHEHYIADRMRHRKHSRSSRRYVRSSPTWTKA